MENNYEITFLSFYTVMRFAFFVTRSYRPDQRTFYALGSASMFGDTAVSFKS